MDVDRKWEVPLEDEDVLGLRTEKVARKTAGVGAVG